ncbi:lipopolysaccharide biosynthesis protein [Streptosporangium jomthongense]|uniref:Lipopolysaccharide biosynthesis protein n=1 Tax=Streptosporangium jomthongense TaxID=1193683 RepID=A0ABV8FCQ9_9ACTN
MAPLISAGLARLPRVGGAARDGLAGLVGAGVGAGAQFLTVVLVTRGTDRQTAGAFFTATALCLTVAGVLRLDAGNGLVHAIAGTGACGHDRARGQVRAALAPVAALSVAVGTVLFACLSDPAFRVLAVALPAVVCADVLVSATRGFGMMLPTLLLDGLLQPVAQLVLVSLAVASGVRTVPVLVAAWALPYVPVLCLAALWLRGRLPHTPYAGPYALEAARELWCHTWPRSAAAAIQAVFQRLDVMVVAVLAGPEEAAVYTAATRFKVVGQLVNRGLAQAAQPRLVEALTAGNLGRARALYQSATTWLVALTWPLWLGYALCAPWLLGLLGDGYASGAAVALVLAVTMMLAGACGMVDVVLTAAGYTRSSLANLVAAITVTTACGVFLTPAYGAAGAALAWASGTLVKNLLPLWQIHRRLGLRPFGAHSLGALRPWRPR